MSIAQKEHEEILELIKESGINEKVLKVISEQNRAMIKQTIWVAEGAYEIGIENAIKLQYMLKAPKEMIETIESLKDKRFFKFLKWIDKETNHRFYIAHMSNDGSVGLWTRDFKVLVKVRMCWGNESVTKLVGRQRVLDIESIHSFQKGEGYKVMKNVLSFAKRHELPVTLWTETKENVKYFERYGFINHGNHGTNNEYLMILKEQ